jgi:hypothetical protein
MVCVWPLSPSSCEFATVAVAITNMVVKKISTVVA